MRIRFTIVIAAIMIANLLAFAVANAEDVLADLKVTNVVVAKTKAGNEYVRLSTTFPAELNGVRYTKTAAVMVFDSGLIQKAKTVKPGESIKAVLDKGSYQGRDSFVLIGMP